MPSFRCQRPTCTNYVPARGYCPDCQRAGHTGSGRATEHAYYDQHQRDREMKRFYDSTAWRQTRAAKLAAQPWCGRCGKLATTVHHVAPAKQAPDLRLVQSNLESLCGPCHSELEREIRGKRGHDPS